MAPLNTLASPVAECNGLFCRAPPIEGFPLRAVSRIQQRWKFSDWKANISPTSSGQNWSSGQARSWTGGWNIGQLFLWTFIIFGSMIGCFLLIVFIFFACGILDDRRLKRNAKRTAARKRKSEKQKQRLIWKALKNHGSNPPKETATTTTKSIIRDNLNEKPMRSIDSAFMPRQSVPNQPVQMRKIDEVSPIDISSSFTQNSSIESVLKQMPKTPVVPAIEGLYNVNSVRIPATSRLSIDCDNLASIRQWMAPRTAPIEGSGRKE